MTSEGKQYSKMRRVWIGFSICVLLLLYIPLQKMAWMANDHFQWFEGVKSQLKNQNVFIFKKVIQDQLPEPGFPKNNSNHQKYILFNTQILERLKSLPRPMYQDSRTFIDYGQPVSKLLPPNYPKVGVKRILDWTGFWARKRTVIPEKLTCGEGIVCERTLDRNKLLTSDAVVFHGPDFNGRNILPKERLPYQRWVFFTLESPYLAGIKPSKFNGVFNYTVSYRRDSDFQVTYFNIYPLPKTLTNTEHKKVVKDIMATRTKLVAQMNSNCKAKHTDRLAYIRELQKYIDVDTYGRCGTLKCPLETKECLDKMKSYKFYMAMENSHCRDYITEKVARPLFEYGSVPVIMGLDYPANYEQFMPPGSYIPTAGFESPKKLAEYLVFLDKNPDYYERFHDWRRNYTGTIYEYDVWCKLCRKLHNTSAPVQTYRDLSGWYAQDVCSI